MHNSRKKFTILLLIIFACALVGYEAYQNRSELVLLQSFKPNHINQYAEENKKLQKQSDRKVVVIGDSIVYAWRFPEKINDYWMVNRGISGETTEGLIGRFNSDAIKIKPQYIVILIGINDIAAKYETDRQDMDLEIQKIRNNIKFMTARAKSKGIQPIVCSVLPVNESYRLPAQIINNIVIQLNNELELMTKAEGIIYLDFHSTVVDKNTGMLIPDFSNDGIHPNEKGYHQMWKLLVDPLI